MVVGRKTFGWLAASGLVLSLATGCGAGASSTSQENGDDLENESIDRSAAAIKVSTPDDPNPPLPIPTYPPPPPPTPTGLWSNSATGYDLRIPTRCSAAKSYVARLRGATCAVPSSLTSEWTAAPVFSQASRLSVRNAFCRFTWKAAGNAPADRVSALESAITEYTVSHYDWTGATTMPAGPDVRPECPAPLVYHPPTNPPVIVRPGNGGPPIQTPLWGGAAEKEATNQNALAAAASDDEVPSSTAPPGPPPAAPIPRGNGMPICGVCAIADGNTVYIELPASEVRDSAQSLSITDSQGTPVGTANFGANSQQATVTVSKSYSAPTPLTLMGE